MVQLDFNLNVLIFKWIFFLFFFTYIVFVHNYLGVFYLSKLKLEKKLSSNYTYVYAVEYIKYRCSAL